MPAKKNQKAKKAPAKKVVAKKPVKKATKAVKKPVKKIATKKVPAKKLPAKKTPTKKVVAKKLVKKTPAKVAVKKTLKKIEKKLPKKLQKPAKQNKTEKVEVKKSEKIAKQNESLAKKILAKHSKKSKPEQEYKASQSEVKKEINQRAIIVRKSDNKNKTTFKVGDYAVYPSHGVGKIIDIEKTNILNQEFKCYLMHFEKERLTIKIPMNSADKIGLRPLISKKEMDEVFVILRSGIKKLKGMWSRRAQEYETKINSGDIMLLAEVLRDLTRDIEDSERSYSERIIYETAIYRLASEYAVIYGIIFEEAKEKIIVIAKDKLGSEPRVNQRDEFDDFDDFDKKSSDDDEEEEEDDEEEEEEDDDFDYDFDDEDDDEAPRKKRKK